MESETGALDKSFTLFSAGDFSPFSMFMAADGVVQAVIVVLMLASLISWTIALAKIVEITWAKRKAHRALQFVLNAQTFTHLTSDFKNQQEANSVFLGAGAIFLEETLKEVNLSTQQVVFIKFQGTRERKDDDSALCAFNEGVKERVHLLLARCVLTATRHMACGTAVLATIGAIAPFVGLFATVWGIMNAFIGIAQTQTTRLDVVAPGIAEALLATAIGLFVAIPAVVMYNGLTRALNGYRNDLGDIAAAIERLLSRELDQQRQQKSRKQ
ncbi:tonB-system energizer ExbB [Bartonella schoenbuchensis]|uniref:Biopolymer transport protein ExbB n=3 Tax=Bartonella schoenbuchensis TaxID=165694 RepID=A0A1S6XS63_BARSR|nr:tonB-system energizer ExbB [Bartonella schoenbuchensis]AQX31341.1 outer membrane transport energization protein ExbB [Bartonella schoenbuchensis R1]ENN90621.1 biopolymer transport protein ExbB [Bartonella schoenbuchensis m07a]